ncbi:MAG TPA: glycosyltransferase, partial [Gemmataceae bacterium]|nr:glycosyltransferase [Gemmataceae bacterium]
EAVLARPDLPPSRVALGTGLLGMKQPQAALPHLREAAAANPFDRDAAHLLFDALGAVADEDGQRRLAAARRLLAKAAPDIVPTEAWFQNAPPVGDELASIIILCCNQVAYTRLCLESVLRHTRPPYELILIDNASTDDTPSVLADICQRQGPARVVLIRNETNLGFPAGCNQGLAQARGRYIVFLNNDTVVTTAWLDGLIAWALHDWPKIGLVGAVSNYVSPEQTIAVPYTARDLDWEHPADFVSRVEAFATGRRAEFTGKALRLARLSGFCLLARRDVLEQIGGFDERYGLGFFDDDDLCVRAREAGFGLLAALNVFIHHFGSQTFHALGLDCRQELRKNFEQFKAKWGEKHAAGYRLAEKSVVRSPSSVVKEQPVPGPGLRATDQGLRTKGVSLCMIVKNEEENLPACLRSVVDLVDETIIVDTGSTDRTKEIAASFGARVFDFPWVDSFAAARNECVRHATRSWIFWMDADDRVEEESRRKLRELFGRLGEENAAYVMHCVCLPDPVTGAATEVHHVRLFPNHPDIRWKYRIHEQILPAVRDRGGLPRFTDVVIHHIGYQDASTLARKRERDLRLLLLEHAEQPDDPFTLFNLASTYVDLKRPADALPLLRKSLERSDPSDSIVRKLYYLIILSHRQLGEKEQALAACREGRSHYPQDMELLSQQAQVHRELGNLPAAEETFLELLAGEEQAHFASVPVGLRGYWTRNNLASLYWEQKRAAEAEAQWRAALAERPDFSPALFGLAEVFLAQARWPELEEVLT